MSCGRSASSGVGYRLIGGLVTACLAVLPHANIAPPAPRSAIVEAPDAVRRLHLRRDPARSATGEPVDVDKSFADVIEQIELADRVGLDVFGLGEHHRPDYAVSAPAVALAAAAARTKRIRLTSAVTVLSSDDPVRVYQQFATLDLISGGRAEIMAGRGSFIEVLSAVRLRPRRLRRAVRGEARSPASDPRRASGHLERPASRAA